MRHLLCLLAGVSIVFFASAQSEYCLDGTVWDSALGGCVPEAGQCDLQYDFNGDGSVGAGDLLMFLIGFGATIADSDLDGVCDGIDDCVGVVDDCGICNGPGAIYECGCADIPQGDCDCLGSQLDAIGECGGDCLNDVNNDGICDELEPADCGLPVSYQGYDYATVLIGDQCWFAENLRNENYENGDAIPADLSDSEWSSTTSGGTAVYGEGSSDCFTDSPDGDACDEAWSLNEYGRLYNWYAVDDARGLCPSGWHVPTDGEWMTMEMALGMSESEANSDGFRGTDQGTQMKTTYGWNNGGNGTNSSGFSGLPGGYRFVTNGSFNYAGSGGYWWSSSPVVSLAWSRYLYYVREDVYRLNVNPQSGFSVRCVRDAE